jgi:hypothetical protein
VLASSRPTHRQSDLYAYVLKRATNTVTLLSEGLDASPVPGTPDGISDDGRYALFESGSDDIVTGDSNAATDVFWTDLTNGTTSRLDVDPGGTLAGRPIAPPLVRSSVVWSRRELCRAR